MSIQEIRPSLYRITAPFHGTGVVFLYLIRGRRVALIDSGDASSPAESIAPALGQIGLSLADVDLLLNTHGHLDHAGGNAAMRRLSRAAIYLHGADLALAGSTEAEIAFHTDPLRVLGYPQAAIDERTEHVLHCARERTGVDEVLSDGDTIDLGDGIVLRALHCPGHTPGLTAFLWEAEGVIVTGDGVQGLGGRPGAYPYYFDAPAYRRTLARLSEVDFDTICLGHAFLGGTLINNPVRHGAEARAFLANSIQVADTIQRYADEVVSRLPGASKRDLVYTLRDELVYEIPQLRLRVTDMPVFAGPTLLSHVEAALEGTYPV